MGNTQNMHSVTPSRKIIVIACGALAHELIAIQKLNQLGHIEIRCLPAILHNSPKEIPRAIEQAIIKAQAEVDKIYIAFGDCGTGGLLDKMLEKYQISRISGPHCYSFYSGNEAFAHNPDNATSFFVTDFLIRQWEAFFVKPMGLDRHPELREDYFRYYRKLVYLAQSNNKNLQQKAQQAANFLELDYEYRFTGYGELQGFLIDST